MGGQRGIVGLGHSRNEPNLGDAAGMAQVGLQDRGRSLLQNFSEAPLGEDALAGGDGQVGAPGDIGHDLHVLAVDRLLDEHGLVGFQRLDEQFGRLGGNGSVKVDADISFRSGGPAQLGELLGRVLHELRGFHRAGGAFLGRSRLECRKPLLHLVFHCLRRTGMGIHPDPLPGRTPQQLVDGNLQSLALDVPKRLIDAAQRAGENRASAIEGVTVDCLPVVGHRPRILADQVGFQLLDGGGAGPGPALQDRLSPAGDSRVGVDLQEQPAGLHQESLQPGDAHEFPGACSPGLRGRGSGR